MAITPIIIKDGNNASQNMSELQDLAGNNLPMVSTDSGRQVYRASANFTPFVTAAVTVIQIKGSATKTVRIKRIGIGGVSTANAQSIFQLLRTTTTGAGGTGVTPTVSKLDSASAAATAVVTHFTTAAQTSGAASGGPISTFNIQTCVVTTPTLGIGQLQPSFPEFGAPIGQSIVLRGVADFLEVQNVTPANLSAATVLAYFVEWEEDGS